jgi:pimeloyl-ACP methyl ester carboxylesterase
MAVRLILAVCLAVLLLACPAASAKTVWLCKPGLAKNPCLAPLTATVIGTNGPLGTNRVRRARRPAIDCFYVYPTVSGQPTTNANREIEAEQLAVARQQASRFAQVCRPFAPVYRQLTIAGVQDPAGIPAGAARRAYLDVRAAWREYLRRHNRGRGVVLIGHSQGTYILRELVTRVIDRRRAVRRRLVSALLTGGNVLVRKGRFAGGDFRNIEACRRASQSGCVIAYSLFSETPPADARFGRAPSAFPGAGGDPSKLEVLCTNPAALAGGSGRLQALFRTERFPGLLGAVTGEPPEAQTAWAALPARYTARCINEGGASWLDVTARPGDPRHTVSQTLGPAWGLHLYDMNLPLGNLVEVVRRQASAYRRSLR